MNHTTVTVTAGATNNSEIINLVILLCCYSEITIILAFLLARIKSHLIRPPPFMTSVNIVLMS